MTTSDRSILLVDAMNLFLRAYSAYPQMTTHGEHVGGVVGFMKMLSRIVSESKPKAVYVAWEGGGSQRRRKLFKEYKKNRKPQRLNRFYEGDIPDTEENKKNQLLVLLACLKHVPVCQLYAADCEGDDVLAYLCRASFKGEKKVLVSSDRDMYQLLDDNTMQYSLHKKMFVTQEEVFKEFRVSTKNFAVAKALCGDAGDNIPGIKGLGFKRLVKLFPMMANDDASIQKVIEFSWAHKDENKIYERVIEGEDVIRRNWRLVYLNDSMISATQASRLDHVVDTFEPRIDKMGLMKKLIDEGINDFDINAFFLSFHCIEGLSYGSKK